MPTTNKIGYVIDTIITGGYDEGLDRIASAVKERQEILDPTYTPVIGTAKFADNIRPKYLIGKKVTIVKVNPKNCIVNLDEPIGTWYRGISCPKTMLCEI